MQTKAAWKPRLHASKPWMAASAAMHAVLMNFCNFPCVFTNCTQYSRLHGACKPRLHVNHGCMQTTDDPHSSPMKNWPKTPRFGGTEWKYVKNGNKKKEKWGLIFWAKVQNGIRPTPPYRCFQRANFDTPRGHHEFCMQVWPTQTDSHSVLHFKELRKGVPCPLPLVMNGTSLRFLPFWET